MIHIQQKMHVVMLVVVVVLAVGARAFSQGGGPDGIGQVRSSPQHAPNATGYL